MQNLVRTLAAVVVLAAFSPALHLRLERSLPAKDAAVQTPPAEIRLWFNQVVRHESSAIVLHRGDVAVALPPVERTDDAKSFRVALDDSLGMGAGVYRVDWTAAGDDEQPVKGSFAFTVKGGTGRDR